MSARAAIAATACLALVACPEAPLATPDSGVPTTPRAPAALIPPASALAPIVLAHTLPSGLRVFLVPNRGAPLVNVQVWVEAGSADENAAPHSADHGLTGISHFFEHLMFQGTARFPNYDAALAPLGARNNAFTHTDNTVFWVSAPREHLRQILDIEADRFANLALDFVHVEPEREVVKSERRQNVDASPAELAEERLLRDTFDQGPYRFGPIGRMRDVDAITLEEVQAYHRQHYVPSAMFLVIAGDFDEAEALREVTDLWSNVGTSGPAPTPVTAPAESWPAETWIGPRTDHIIRPATHTTALWSFRAPAPGTRASANDFAREERGALARDVFAREERGALARDVFAREERGALARDVFAREERGALARDVFAREERGALARDDFAALELIDWALTAGKSGRLQRRLVLGADARLSSLEASLDSTSRLPKAYEWRAELLPGADVAAVEDALSEELAAVARFGLSADELAAAAQSLRADLIQRTLGNADRGELIGFGLRTDGSATTFLARLERYGAITADEVRQAAARWLVPAARVRVVVVTPERLTALVDAWILATPEASAIATLAREATENFLARTEADREAEENEREDRALARLRQRADVALKTAGPDEAAFIRRYLETTPTGTVQRAAALAKATMSIRQSRAQLETKRASLLRTFVNTMNTSAAPLARMPLATAVRLLLSDPQAALELTRVEAPAPGVRVTAQASARMVLEGWILESRGLAQSANDRFIAAQEAAEHVVDPDALTLHAKQLAHDLIVSNLPLADVPRFTVRPTFSPPGQPAHPHSEPRPEPLR